jgi:peroxiredoxin
MEQQEQKQRDWIYLLPGGQSAENMKVGRTILSEQSGHSFSSESFRSLVKKGVIKKIKRFDYSITTQSDATTKTNNK